jgi:hypothetical protein
VSDAGLSHLKDIKALTWLSLWRTSVSDAGLGQLKEVKGLTFLEVGGTKVTAKGLADFHAVVPGCKIVHDGGVIEAVDVDRAVAEWVIAQGGYVRINGSQKDIKTAADLPKDRFALMNVYLSNTRVPDAGLAHLKDMSLTELYLGGTPIGDAAPTYLKGLKSLTRLFLNQTLVSDAGLMHLKEIKGLTWLSLQGTSVSDAGLAHLKVLKSLVYLDLRQTKVTAKGAADFHAAVPGCKVMHDGGVIEPKE